MSEIDHPPVCTESFVRVYGNEATVFERRRAPLCFEQPYYNHVNLGPLKVLKEPRRMTVEAMEDRGAEALGYAGRRIRESRRLQFEDKERIKEVLERERQEREAKEARPSEKLRWWQTRAALDERDLLRSLNAINGRFSAELLLNAKDIVNCNLTGCRLGNEAMNWVSTFIVQNGTLRRLCLQANHITVDGVNNLYNGLRESKSLLDLDLSLNPIGDDGMAALVGAFTENMRFTKLQKLNVSTCDLSPSSCYHVARFIRDFKTLEILLAWRNRLGNVQVGASGTSGIALVFAELAANTTLKHIDLTCNNISEEFCSVHATEKEQEARQNRLAEIDKARKQNKIDELVKTISELRPVAVYEDQKIELASLETELVAERKRYAEDLARQKQREKTEKKDAEAQYRELLLKMTGRTLIERKSRLRIVLTGNPAIQPMTLKRLKAFYDVSSVADYEAFVNIPRSYDNIVRGRRRPGHPEDAPDPTYNVFDFEDELLVKERLEREARTKEMEELRKKGYDATAILEERLRGTASRRHRSVNGGAAAAAGGSSDGSRTATPRDPLALTGATPPPTGSLKSPRGNLLLIPPGSAAGGTKSPRDTGLLHSPRNPTSDNGSQGPKSPRPAGGTTVDLGSGIVVTDSSAAGYNSSSAFDSDASASTRAKQPGRRTQRRTKRALGSAMVAVSVANDRKVRAAAGDKQKATAAQNATGDDDEDPTMDSASGFVETYDDLDKLIENDGGGGDDMFAKLRAMLPDDDAAEQAAMQRKMQEKNAEIRMRLLERMGAIPTAEVEEAAMAASGSGGSPPNSARGAAAAIVAASSGTLDGSVMATGGGNATVQPADGSGGGFATALRSVLPPPPPPPEETGQEVIAVGEEGELVNRVEGASDAANASPEIANSLLFDGMAALRRIQAAIRAISERGSPSDEDLAELAKEQTRQSRFMYDFAQKLGELTAYVEVDQESVETVTSFFEDLLKMTDRDPAVVSLVEAITMRVNIDFAELIDQRGLASLCATDGSLEFLRVLLNIPGFHCDVPELMLSCFYNQMCRIPVTYFVLTSPVIDLSPYADVLQASWQEFFEDIASSKRAIPKEDRTNRDELLKLMLNDAHFQLDLEQEGSDGRTAFGRACSDGDGALVTMMAFSGKVTNPNKPNSSGLTPLMQAVFSKNLDCVNALFDMGTPLDVNAVCETGTALDMANLLRVDPAIVSVLKEHGAASSRTTGKGGAAAASAKPAPKVAAASKPKVTRRTTKTVKS